MTDQTTTYGFVGLGHQGRPMSQRMIDDGLRPWLWARRAEILDLYRNTEAELAASLRGVLPVIAVPPLRRDRHGRRWSGPDCRGGCRPSIFRRGNSCHRLLPSR